MIITLAIAAIAALVIGTVFGQVAATGNKPMSDSFRIYGPVWSAAAGLVCAVLAAIFGVSLWVLLAAPVAAGVIGCAAVELQVWLKKHG